MTAPRVIDANVILRYLLGDHPAVSPQAAAFFEQVRRGEAAVFIPEGVLVECVYVLIKFYAVPRPEVAEKLSQVIRYRGVINPNREILLEALALFARRSVDIVDAIVFVTAQHHGWTTFSFDRDLRKLEGDTDPTAC
jgi:predicted nucleic-acid-binding protein